MEIILSKSQFKQYSWLRHVTIENHSTLAFATHVTQKMISVLKQISLLIKAIVAGKRSIEMTVSDDTCTLDVYEDSRFGYIKENVINVDEMNCFLVNINICFTSYFTFISQQFVSPNISKFTVGLIILKPSPYSKLHFRLIISFDEHVTEVASRIKETPSVLVINILILSTVNVKIRYTLHVGIIP